MFSIQIGHYLGRFLDHIRKARFDLVKVTDWAEATKEGALIVKGRVSEAKKRAFEAEEKLGEATKKALEAERAQAKERKKQWAEVRLAEAEKVEEVAIEAVEVFKTSNAFIDAMVEFASFAYVDGLK